MRRITRTLLLVLVASLMFPLQVGLAEAPVTVATGLVDLRHNAPEGTFLPLGTPPILTQDSYQSQDIHIRITRLRDEESRSDVTIADVWVSSLAYLRRAYALNRFDGEMGSMKTLATENRAILAMTGDYANLLNAGLSVGNGQVHRKSENSLRDNGLLLKDGRMLTFQRRQMDVPGMLALGVWQAFLFGPALLVEGQAIERFDSTIRRANPRSAIGYYEPGHYAFVVVDGRSSASRGMTLEQLSAFMQGLGMQAAYNLDGGQSAMLWFNGEVITKPVKGGRRLKDILVVGELPVTGEVGD